MADFSWAALASGLAGAVIGALSNAYLRYRSDRKTAREALVGEIVIFTDECLAAISDLHAAAIMSQNRAEKWKALAQYRRAFARGMAIETRVFREFKSRPIRAGFNKVLSRLEKFSDLVAGEDEPVADATFTMASGWVSHQLSRTISLASRAAGIDTVDKGRVHFIGFKRASRSDLEALSFEDGPPPWLFHLDVQVQDMDKKSREECAAHNRPKVENMKCPKHGRPPHVYFVGRTSKDFSVEVEGCCPEFSESVHRKLTTGEASFSVAP